MTLACFRTRRSEALVRLLLESPDNMLRHIPEVDALLKQSIFMLANALLESDQAGRATEWLTKVASIVSGPEAAMANFLHLRCGVATGKRQRNFIVAFAQ